LRRSLITRLSAATPVAALGVSGCGSHDQAATVPMTEMPMTEMPMTEMPPAPGPLPRETPPAETPPP